MFEAYVEGDELKVFMQRLFKENVFDRLCVRSCELTTNISYIFEGKINKDWFEEGPEETYCTWGELRPMVCELIKGKKRPSVFKLVLSSPEKGIEKIHPNAKALFLNIKLNEERVELTSGVSQIKFELNKSLEESWENTLEKFMKRVCIYNKGE